jgi:hypothetical protein
VNEFALRDRVVWADVPSSYVKRAVVPALDDVGQAHADLEARRTTGKLLVAP